MRDLKNYSLNSSSIYVFVCLENSFEVKIEAAGNDITECPCDDKPSVGTLFFIPPPSLDSARGIFYVVHLSRFSVFGSETKVIVSGPHSW